MSNPTYRAVWYLVILAFCVAINAFLFLTFYVGQETRKRNMAAATTWIYVTIPMEQAAPMKGEVFAKTFRFPYGTTYVQLSAEQSGAPYEYQLDIKGSNVKLRGGSAVGELVRCNPVPHEFMPDRRGDFYVKWWWDGYSRPSAPKEPTYWLNVPSDTACAHRGEMLHEPSFRHPADI